MKVSSIFVLMISGGGTNATHLLTFVLFSIGNDDNDSKLALVLVGNGNGDGSR